MFVNREFPWLITLTCIFDTVPSYTTKPPMLSLSFPCRYSPRLLCPLSSWWKRGILFWYKANLIVISCGRGSLHLMSDSLLLWPLWCTERSPALLGTTAVQHLLTKCNKGWQYNRLALSLGSYSALLTSKRVLITVSTPWAAVVSLLFGEMMAEIDGCCERYLFCCVRCVSFNVLYSRYTQQDGCINYSWVISHKIQH